MGDRRANCEEAIDRLGRADGIDVAAVSSLYETVPEGGPPQRDYLNGVAGVYTALPPRDLLEKVLDIEKAMGRKARKGRDLPRIIDLDILLYGDLVTGEADLVIPHPRMHRRSFVLRGLAEIAPDVIHPVSGKSVSELYEGVKKCW